jgi:hypothetical protein
MRIARRDEHGRARRSIDLAVAESEAERALKNTAVMAVFPIGAELKARNVPFLFASGYDRTVIPPEFSCVPMLEKPFSTRLLVHRPWPL